MSIVKNLENCESQSLFKLSKLFNGYSETADSLEWILNKWNSKKTEFDLYVKLYWQKYEWVLC